MKKHKQIRDMLSPVMEANQNNISKIGHILVDYNDDNLFANLKNFLVSQMGSKYVYYWI